MNTIPESDIVGFSMTSWLLPREINRDASSAEMDADSTIKRRQTQALDSLIDLSQKGGMTDEDDLRWPTRRALEVASSLVTAVHQQRRCFDRVVSDGEGGVSLEIRRANKVVRLRVEEDGKIVLMRFENSRLVSHEVIPVGSH